MEQFLKNINKENDNSKPTTFLKLTLHLAKVVPDKEAFVFRRADVIRYPLTWAKYAHLGNRFAARLQGMGFSKGDVICNFLVNSLERVITELGTVMAGAVPLHGEVHLADGADIRETFKKADVKAAIVDPEHYIGDRQVLKIIDTLPNDGNPSAEKIIILSKRSKEGSSVLLQELEESAEEYTPVEVDSDDVAFILSTSGSTGFSKLVPNTHGQFGWNMGSAVNPAVVAATTKREFNDASFGWGSGAAFIQTLTGATRVLTDIRAGHPADYPKFVWDSIVQENCTAALLMTSMINNIYQRPDVWQGSRHLLDTVVTGGQPLTKSTMITIGHLTKSVISMYGSTEAGFLCLTTFTNHDEFEEYLAGTPTAQMKVVDENLTSVPNGTKGEILVKNKGQFKGYLGDPEATKKALTVDGWFRTNDLGYLDDRGRLFVMGRRSDAIMKGSQIIYPSWLEPRIRLHPGVADVIVVPVPDPVLHHEICACVIRKEGSDVSATDLDDFCKKVFVSEVNAAEDINPKYFLFFKEFPLNKNNKTDREKLAKIAGERINSFSPDN